MNPEIDFVSLLGQAGTGKRPHACRLRVTQTLMNAGTRKSSSPARQVSVGEEIGFLPAQKKKKMVPWMGLWKITSKC